MLHAPKNGFFYVIDRTNGELISADNFVETTWASHIDMETGRPVEVPGSRYEGAVASVLAAGTEVTYDLRPGRSTEGAAGTREMAAAIIRAMER